MRNKFILTKEKNPQLIKRMKNSGFLKTTGMMILLLMTIFMWQCKKDEYKGETKGVCPEVISTVPADKAIDIVTSSKVTVTFNEKMNPSTITTSTFLLNQGTNAVTGTVTPTTGETATFTFTPASPLAPFTLYSGTMKKGVKDPMNNALQEDYNWSFTTQPEVSVSALPLLGGTASIDGSINKVKAFNVDAPVTVKAVPSVGYTFTNWTEAGIAVSPLKEYTFSLTMSRTLVANFAINMYSLNITLTPALGGTVAKVPNQTTFSHGTSVQLTATPATGFTFTSWTGDVTGTTNQANVIMNSDKNVTANFTAVIPKYTVALSSNPLLGGTTTGAGSFDSGASVTVNAVPAVGYTFTNWTEGANIVSSNASYTFNLSSNRILVANFTAVVPQFTLALSSNPLLGGTTSGGGSFNSGTSVTALAVPAVGYTFTNWTEGENIVSSNASYTFNLSGNRTLVANFTAVVPQFTVALSSNPFSGGTTTGAGSFDSGVSVTVRAIPAVGYTFKNWIEGVNIVSTNANYTFNITSNKILVANFTASASQFTVALSSIPLLGGTTTGAGTFNSGASVTVRAVPAIGYTFKNWTEGVNIVSSNANYTFNITSDRILVANFSPVVVGQFMVSLSSNPALGGTTDGEGSFDSGSSVTITAMPNSGFTFKNWTEGANIVSTNANYTFTINGNRTFVANFDADVIPPVGPAPIDLGSAGDFTALSKSGISTTGVTSVAGDIGVSPAAATAITGFGLIMDINGQSSHTPIVTGKVYASDYAPPTPAKMTTAVSDMETAYTTGNNLVVPAPIVGLYAGDISGRTLATGLYKWGSGVLITNAGVTLSGSANDVWIFQIAQNLTVENSAIVHLVGGAQAKNVFWIVAGQATLGTNSDFSGIILSKTLISLNTGAKVTGKLLAQTAVTLNASTVVEP